MRDERRVTDEAIDQVARAMTTGVPSPALRHAVRAALVPRAVRRGWSWGWGLAAATAVTVTVGVVVWWPMPTAVPDEPRVATPRTPVAPSTDAETPPPVVRAELTPAPPVATVDTSNPPRDILATVVSLDAAPIVIPPLAVVARGREPLTLGPLPAPEPIAFMPLTIDGVSF